MTDRTIDNGHPAGSRLRAWGLLCLGFVCVGMFAFVVGPWLQHKIPVYEEIVQVIQERDIDAGAYFYTEIEASYDGERYLLESMKLAAPAIRAEMMSPMMGNPKAVSSSSRLKFP